MIYKTKRHKTRVKYAYIMHGNWQWHKRSTVSWRAGYIIVHDRALVTPTICILEWWYSCNTSGSEAHTYTYTNHWQEEYIYYMNISICTSKSGECWKNFHIPMVNILHGYSITIMAATSWNSLIDIFFFYSLFIVVYCYIYIYRNLDSV